MLQPSYHKFSARISTPAAALIACGAIYFLLASLLPPYASWCGDNSYRLLLVQTLVRNHFTDISFNWPGHTIDPAFQYCPLLPPYAQIVAGKAYTSYPIFFPALAAPFYLLLGNVGLKLPPILGSLLLLGACARILKHFKLCPKPIAIAVALVAFASPVLFYSLVFWEHTLALGLNLWSIYFLLKWRESHTIRRVLLSAGLLGLSIYLRAENYLLIPALMLLFLSGAGFPACADKPSASKPSLRIVLLHLCAFVSLLLLCIALLCLTNLILYGHPMGLHIGANQPLQQGLAAHIHDRGLVLKRLFLNVSYYRPLFLFVIPPFLIGFLAALLDLKIPRKLAAFFLLWAAIGGIRVMNAGLDAGHRGAWLSEVNSLYPLCPLILGGLLPITKNTELRLLRRMLIVFCILYALAAPVGSSQGFHWANRFLLLAYPLLIVIGSAEWGSVLSAIPKRKLAFEYVSICSIAVASLILQIFSFYLLQSKALSMAESVEIVRAEPDAVIVSEIYEAVDYLFPVFFTRPIYHVSSPQEFADLRSRLERTGPKNYLILSRWGTSTGANYHATIIDRAYLAQPFSIYRLGQ